LISGKKLILISIELGCGHIFAESWGKIMKEAMLYCAAGLIKEEIMES
jgi:hypothetical protein